MSTRHDISDDAADDSDDNDGDEGGRCTYATNAPNKFANMNKIVMTWIGNELLPHSLFICLVI